MAETCWKTTGLNENFIDTLAREHNLYVGPGGKELVGENLDDGQTLRAEIDIVFARNHPGLPVENVCSRLDNYFPQNASQMTFHNNAEKLVKYRNPSRLAGFIACGGAGLGKTHLAIAVAKASMQRMEKALYVNVPRDTGIATLGPDTADIIVIDDLNNRYTNSGAHNVCNLLAAMHDKGGGKLMITSNAPDPETFLTSILLPNDAVERVRLGDRVRAALLGLTVTGESYRSRNATGQTPWWLE